MTCRLFAVLLCLSASLGNATAQVPEFDFYPAFRVWLFTLPAEQRQPLEALLERYQQRLAAEKIPAREISRRVTLIRTRRPDLEADYWDRVFTIDTPIYNTAPNSFLVEILKGRKPGRALDVGMGGGRNTLYLAQQGWDAHGFDPAGKAVAQAQQHAKNMGLTITTSVTHDRDFAFGAAQWDLILLSWMPVNEPERLTRALRPGGIVVFEGPRMWFAKNGLLKMFDDLRVLHYADVTREGDYFQGQKIPVLRFIAERPIE
jgi:SAM-dependent methyltransferase